MPALYPHEPQTAVMMLTLALSVMPEQRDEVVRLFESYAGPVSVQPGCVGARLYSGLSQRTDLLIVEEWDAMEAFQKHVRSDEFRRILSIMELANEPPRLRFHRVASVEGLGLVERLRRKTGVPDGETLVRAESRPAEDLEP